MSTPGGYIKHLCGKLAGRFPSVLQSSDHSTRRSVGDNSATEVGVLHSVRVAKQLRRMPRRLTMDQKRARQLRPFLGINFAVFLLTSNQCKNGCGMM